MNSNGNSTATLPLGPDLIGRAQQGDPDAFATLFNTHKKRIYSLCLRMTNNVAQAEELAQDAFLQVFRKLSSFRGDSAFSTWLYRVAMNTVLMQFRKKKLREVSLDEPYSQHEGSEPVAREFATLDSRLETSVTRITLTRAISTLPEGYRTIFLMHDVQGYEHHEIAEMLGCTIGNSKSQLHKARLRIREFLAGSQESRSEADATDRPKIMRGRCQAAYGQVEFLPGRRVVA
jgi:RNA polymerase sigma-70 factor, ECF subfamily